MGTRPGGPGTHPAYLPADRPAYGQTGACASLPPVRGPDARLRLPPDPRIRPLRALVACYDAGGITRYSTPWDAKDAYRSRWVVLTPAPQDVGIHLGDEVGELLQHRVALLHRQTSEVGALAFGRLQFVVTAAEHAWLSHGPIVPRNRRAQPSGSGLTLGGSRRLSAGHGVGTPACVVVYDCAHASVPRPRSRSVRLVRTRPSCRRELDPSLRSG